MRTNNTFFLRSLSYGFHIKNLNDFFNQGHNQKLAKKRGLDLTAINLSVFCKRCLGANPFEVNATVATYWYPKKMQTNKMLVKACRAGLHCAYKITSFYARTNQTHMIKKFLTMYTYLACRILENHFVNLHPKLSTLLQQNFDARIFTYYSSLKTGSYFNLKSKTPAALKSNVVLKFTCSRDVNTTYIGMSTRHLVTRAREHVQLNSNSTKNAIS